MTELPFADRRILGFDVGRSRIGVARSTPLGTSEPLLTIKARNRKMADVLEEIAGLLTAHQINEIVVGLPLNMDGSEGAQAGQSRVFARRLVEKFPGVPVHMEDERLTTEAAYERLAERGIHGEKARHLVDAVAAAIIIEARLSRG